MRQDDGIDYSAPEEAAKKLSGNFLKFENFGYFGDIPEEDRERWCIVYTHTRNSNLLEESNAHIIAESLKKFKRSVRPFEASHWACGWIAGFEVLVYTKKGKVTAAFKELCELRNGLNEYPILDEQDYQGRIDDATWENVKDALGSVVHRNSWATPQPDYHQEQGTPLARLYDAGLKQCEVETMRTAYPNWTRWNTATEEQIKADFERVRSTVNYKRFEEFAQEVYSWLAENLSEALEDTDSQGGYPNDEQIEAALVAIGYKKDGEEVVEAQTLPQHVVNNLTGNLFNQGEKLMTDETEGMRRIMVETINSMPATDRQEAEKMAEDGKVWNTDELQKDFEVVSFLAPYVMVRRKTDGVQGTMMFQHNPRFYFNFKPE